MTITSDLDKLQSKGKQQQEQQHQQQHNDVNHHSKDSFDLFNIKDLKILNVEKLLRADADYIKEVSGISIGGVSPFGWLTSPTILIDDALAQYEVVWAAAGHAHAVFPTNYAELIKFTNGKPAKVASV